MKSQSNIDMPIAIDRPVVIIPADEYLALLKETGHLSTPILSRKIAQARVRFRKGKFIKWEKLKNELL